MSALALAVLISGAALGSCGADRHPPGAAEPSGRLTPPALAWLVDEHIEGEASSAEPMTASTLGRLGEDAVGVRVRFRPSEGDDGDLVEVFTAPWASPGMREYRPLRSCASAALSCARIQGVSLRWDTGHPGEDPGSVMALHRSGSTAVVASFAGPMITGDPRELDLPVSVDELVGLVTDPRVAPVTTTEALAQGARFEVYDDPATPGRDLPGPVLSDPATPATLALLTQDHTAWDAATAGPDPRTTPPEVGIIMQFPPQGGWAATTLRVALRPAQRELRGASLRREARCAESDGCAPSGGALVAWTHADGADPGSITVTRWRAGVMVRASWTGHPVTGDPRQLDGPVLVEEMVSLAGDPGLGIGAPADLTQRAEDMPAWWQY
ncbi:hypothetical protein [Nocardioides furvisabuli]|uniref:hypothetical protein n=1 Tax=Nocardioides furvisabuli TaxID=375542 RepID=UPI001E5BF765|nr:hypothetical protein [Nocardioides furvisabuli]